MFLKFLIIEDFLSEGPGFGPITDSRQKTENHENKVDRKANVVDLPQTADFTTSLDLQPERPGLLPATRGPYSVSVSSLRLIIIR